MIEVLWFAVGILFVWNYVLTWEISRLRASDHLRDEAQENTKKTIGNLNTLTGRHNDIFFQILPIVCGSEAFANAQAAAKEKKESNALGQDGHIQDAR